MSLVPALKFDGSMCSFWDYKVIVNKVANVQSYPLPTIDDLLASLTGGKVVSKLDMSHAYLQLSLDEKSKNICYRRSCHLPTNHGGNIAGYLTPTCTLSRLGECGIKVQIHAA